MLINVLVSSFCFIWIHIFLVMSLRSLILSVQGSTLDVRFWRLKSIPALMELTHCLIKHTRHFGSKGVVQFFGSNNLCKSSRKSLICFVFVLFPRFGDPVGAYVSHGDCALQPARSVWHSQSAVHHHRHIHGICVWSAGDNGWVSCVETYHNSHHWPSWRVCSSVIRPSVCLRTVFCIVGALRSSIFNTCAV